MITLATLPQATAQEVFDQVKNHLLTQNECSMDSEDERCLYRGRKGLKCAAGCLIGDDEYKPEMDSTNEGGVTWSCLNSKGLVPADHQLLISDLQDVHDSRYPEDWPLKLRVVARSHNLKYN